MESPGQKHQGTCQDTEQLLNPTINRLADEVLLEVFDSYRQSIDIDQYDSQWRREYSWFNLTLVCRRWRAVMFGSSSRLDLNIVVGPKKPDHIKTVLSGHLPILIDYDCLLLYESLFPYEPEPLRDITGSALWRMRAALGHRDRVREISFGGWDAISMRKFISATNYHFPALESLDIRFPHDEPEIPSTFLRGPDQSDLRLRRLRLYGVSVASVSGLLLSATALTYLYLSVTSAMASQGSLLLDCLQAMQYLRGLDLLNDSRDSQSQHSALSTPKDIVPLSKLTRFHYSGPTTFLNNLLSGLSAPFLQDVRFVFPMKSPSPLSLYFSRVIDDVREEFRSISVSFELDYFRIFSSAHSRKIAHFKPSFRFNVICVPYPINSMNSTPSTKFAMAEELALDFPSSNLTEWNNHFSLRKFLRQFRSVRVLRLNGFVREVGHYLQQDVGEPIFPVLEEVELSILRLTRYSDEEYQHHVAEALGAFEPWERAGRLVKVYHCERT